LNERKRPVAMVEAGLLTALAIIFTIAGTYIPFLGFFLTIVAIPLALIGIRHGLGTLSTSIVAAGLIGTMVGGIPTGTSVALVAGSAALVIAYSFQHKWSISKMVIGVSIVSIIAFAISFQLMIVISGVDFFELLDASMTQSIQMLEMMTLDETQRAQIVESSELFVETTKMIFPSMLFIMGVMHAAINVVVLKLTMKRMKMPFLEGKPFNEFTYDRSVLIGTSLIMILSYLAGVAGIVDLLTLFTNVILIIAFAFSIQGMAIIDFFFAKRVAKKSLRFFIIALLYLAFNGYIFFGIMGWFDIIFNFRKLERNDH